MTLQEKNLPPTEHPSDENRSPVSAAVTRYAAITSIDLGVISLLFALIGNFWCLPRYLEYLELVSKVNCTFSQYLYGLYNCLSQNVAANIVTHFPRIIMVVILSKPLPEIVMHIAVRIKQMKMPCGVLPRLSLSSLYASVASQCLHHSLHCVSQCHG